jgi:hypothetical protein
MRISVRLLTATAATAVIGLGAATLASAAAPTGDFANFDHCPYANPNVATCFYSNTTAGSLRIGSTSVPLPPSVVQGGFGQDDYPNGAPWYDAVGAPSFPAMKVKVPGGLLGLVDSGGFSGFLLTLFNGAVASLNDVYATTELVGSPEIFPAQIAFTGEAPGLKLALRIHLENPFLGSGCFIGSAANPVRLVLQTGTTSPPPPNTPISGAIGTWAFNSGFSVLTTTGAKMVDNSFAVPAATNCGLLPLDKILITRAVNRRVGLPSAAGRNAIILEGGFSQVAGAEETAASVR